MQTTQAELQGCNNNVGYRQVWVILKQMHGLVVKRYCAVLPKYERYIVTCISMQCILL